MSTTPDELKAILEQVEAELTAMMRAGEVGTLTVHCGRADIYVEVVTKRRYDPVFVQQQKRLAIIRKAR